MVASVSARAGNGSLRVTRDPSDPLSSWPMTNRPIPSSNLDLLCPLNCIRLDPPLFIRLLCSRILLYVDFSLPALLAYHVAKLAGDLYNAVTWQHSYITLARLNFFRKGIVPLKQWRSIILGILGTGVFRILIYLTGISSIGARPADLLRRQN